MCLKNFISICQGGGGNPNPSKNPPKAVGFAHQLQHPWAATTSGKAAKEPEDDDGGACPDEHVGGIGGVLSDEGDVGAEGELSPHSNCEQDNASDLQSKGTNVSGATGGAIQSQALLLAATMINPAFVHLSVQLC